MEKYPKPTPEDGEVELNQILTEARAELSLARETKVGRIARGDIIVYMRGIKRISSGAGGVIFDLRGKQSVLLTYDGKIFYTLDNNNAEVINLEEANGHVQSA